MIELKYFRFQSRSFASGASFKPIGGVCDYEVQNSTVNGVLVTSAENDSPITRISIVYRYEIIAMTVHIY